MPPNEQLDQLEKMMKLLNKGNATEEDVAKLFGTLSKAIKQVRIDLEAKIKDTGNSATESHKKALLALKESEGRVDNSFKKSEVGTKTGLEALKKELRGEIEKIKQTIPTVPDFEERFAELEAKIPTIPDPVPPIQYTAGRNIAIEDSVITNTNPKITVSKKSPDNPQTGDLWVRI